MKIKEGQLAPELELTDQNGEIVSLNKFHGKNVIVYFYPKDNTPGCTSEAVCFRDRFDQFLNKNAVILGVSPDGEASHQSFINQYQLPFLLLSDPEKTVMKEWGAFGEKVVYGKKTTGVIRSTVLINREGVVVKHWPKVTKAADHPLKVLEELKKLT